MSLNPPTRCLQRDLSPRGSAILGLFHLDPIGSRMVAPSAQTQVEEPVRARRDCAQSLPTRPRLVGCAFGAEALTGPSLRPAGVRRSIFKEINMSLNSPTRCLRRDLSPRGSAILGLYGPGWKSPLGLEGTVHSRSEP
jgi:hypothetical protein